MLGVSEREWRERYAQLDGVVDGDCSVEARCEVYWLGVGRWEVEEWVAILEMAMGMGVGEKGGWMGVYGEAWEFLKRAVEEVGRW